MALLRSRNRYIGVLEEYQGATKHERLCRRCLSFVTISSDVHLLRIYCLSTSISAGESKFILDGKIKMPFTPILSRSAREESRPMLIHDSSSHHHPRQAHVFFKSMPQTHA